MSSLLARYDDRYIFMDAAPITESADTRILVELCDFVLLVVPYGRVTKNRIQEAADAIGKDKLLGIVFNDVPRMPKIKLPAFINKILGA
jgi:Mrp family chromosome partitioning ATPase